jgi:serine/threonine protein kinase
MATPTPPDQTDLPTIPGYDINRRVGHGGMGIVYKALRQSDLLWVALKMIVGTRPDLKLRFRREVNAVARLRHPNIVALYDTGEHGGWPYFTMEFVAGGSLAEGRQRLINDARLAVSLVERLARAVHHAHEQGIVHRDLKPGNVLLSEDGEPKISDFGLAKCLDGNEEALTNTSAILGTPAYMAPEVARGETRDAGPAVDIYALGAILYELLTGRVPFPGKNQLEVLDLIRSRPPRPPGGFRANLPPALEALCLRCLEKSPQARPATALELAEELQRIGPLVAEAEGLGPPAAGGEGDLHSTQEHSPHGSGEPSTTDPRPRDEEDPDLTLRPSQASRFPHFPGFEVLEWVAAHGIARVYRARQTKVGRTVTIWALPDVSRDAHVADRFRIEAEVLSRLQHPNIVQLIDVGEHDGFLYRVEERLDGGSLDNRLKRRRFKERDAVALVATLARAVHYMHHALGELVVHRNLKPAAILFTAAGVVKLSDFQVVYAPAFGTDRLDQEGAVVGAPAFMAPEQARGAVRETCPGTDVYGLGGILYECLTGRPPLGPAYPFEDLLRRILNDAPVPPRHHNPEVSRRVERICLKALEKDPSRRHANARELAEELEHTQKGWLG